MIERVSRMFGKIDGTEDTADADHRSDPSLANQIPDTDHHDSSSRLRSIPNEREKSPAPRDFSSMAAHGARSVAVVERCSADPLPKSGMGVA
jgi:hypothetical protein